MSKVINYVSGNFTIRKILVKNIISNYFNGNYNSRDLPNFKVKTSTTLIKLGKEIGKDSSSEIYRFTDKGNNNQSILTTNHALYKYVLENQNGNSPDKPILKCKYCKRNVKNPIGLPISMILKGSEVTFIVIDSFCDFGCCFSFLKRKNSENRYFKDPLYMNAEQLLYCMFYRMYPEQKGKSIADKPDWDLLRDNGGPLTDEEFDVENYQYVSIPSVIILPSKKQYIKLLNKK